MKKTRVLSFLLSVLMLLTVLAVFPVVTSAADVAHDIATAPTTLPDGTPIAATKMWMDMSAVHSGGSTGLSLTAAGNVKVESGNTLLWVNGSDTSNKWRDAAGVMIYVDFSGTTDFRFNLCALGNGSRANGGAGGWVYFQTAPQVYAGGPKNVPGTSSTVYYSENGTTWNTHTANANMYFLDPGNHSGWYFVPFDAFIYQGGSTAGACYTNDSINDVALVAGKNNLQYFLSHAYNDQRLVKIGFKTQVAGAVFGDAYFVYTNAPENASENDATSALNLVGESKEGNLAYTNDAGKITVTGNAVNTATAAGNRVWVQATGVGNYDLRGASGIRFHVDTTALGASARLHPRLRMLVGGGLASFVTSDTYFYRVGGAYDGYAAKADISGGYMQFVTRKALSTAFYDGVVGSTPTSGALAVNGDYLAAEGDYFEALPANFVGDVYIPLDSFALSTSSYANVAMLLLADDPHYQAALAKVMKFALVPYIEGTPATDAVTYSNFELVYGDTDFAGASVTLTNDLGVNFFASVQEGATNAKMTFKVGSKSTTVALADAELQLDGTYLFRCADLLPQSIGDTVTATLSATVSGRSVSASTAYSVKDYCLNMLRKDGTGAALKTLLVDLLYYGADAQTYAGYKTDELVTAALTEAEKGLRSADATSGITAALSKEGTESADYAFTSAALRLGNRMAIKFTFKAPTTEGLTVSIATGERAAVVFQPAAISDNADGTYTVVFNDIAAYEYDTPVTAKLLLNGEQVGQAISYSVAAYIKDYNALDAAGQDKDVVALIRSVYGFGKSALAYLG